jgi:3-dehydroquinate synthase
VRIGPGLLDRAGAEIAPLLRRPRLAVLTDETVAALHLPAFRATCEAAGIAVAALVLPAGEATKSWPHLQRAVEWLLAERIERRDVVVALGGGVIGDLAGFAAAVLRRGVRFVQLPTSLLAQVDSSVGGKTGINSAQGKNLIGAFHQPALVLADTAVLQTLPDRDLLAGYGEVVKYGLLGDAGFFDWLERNGPALRRGDAAARLHAVTRSVQMKADIVARDETEEGERALLNLGHTFCHALEAATGYSDRLLHGEGVAIGCALAFALSQRLGLCAQEAPSRVRAHLREMGMKVDLADIPGALPGPEALLALMAQDKKVVDGRLRFILARGIGEAFVAEDVPAPRVLELLTEALAGR